MPSNLYDECPPAKLWKQFAAMVYDSLLIVAILFGATAILLPFNQGKAITGPLFHFYLVLMVFVFYAGFWKKSGQTLGMQVWKIKIITDYGTYPAWSIGFLRLFLSIVFPLVFLVSNDYFGFFTDVYVIASITLIIFLSNYLNRLLKPYTWHDKLSQTKVIDISKLNVDEKQNSG